MLSLSIISAGVVVACVVADTHLLGRLDGEWKQLHGRYHAVMALCRRVGRASRSGLNAYLQSSPIWPADYLGGHGLAGCRIGC